MSKLSLSFDLSKEGALDAAKEAIYAYKYKMALDELINTLHSEERREAENILKKYEIDDLGTIYSLISN